MGEICSVFRIIRTIAKFVQDFCTIALVHLGCEDEVTVKSERFDASQSNKEG